MDCEDIIMLTRYLSKLKLPYSAASKTYRTLKTLWTQEVMIKLCARLHEPELLHEMRQLYTYK